MNLYRFDWSVFATDTLLDWLLVAAGAAVPTAAARDALRPLVARILATLGGPPVASRQVPMAERTQLAARLLRDACGAALAPRRERTIPGMTIIDAPAGPHRVKAWRRVPLNSASQADIEALPGIGPVLAGRIVAARLVRPLRGLEDLARRVSGIGDELAEGLRHQVTFALPPVVPLAPETADLNRDFAWLADAQAGVDPSGRALAALHAVLAKVTAVPTPAPLVLFESVAAPVAPVLQADAIDVLAGTAYYTQLRYMLDASASRVEVCMFHIALPTAEHPTMRLLESLAAAHTRGVAVRVLVDRDREADPYRSTVINESAAAWLRDAGVAVRHDPADALLHSKFVIVDTDLALIGSHNWTAGSYFQFDDLTLALHSASVAATQRARFDAMWAQADEG